MKLGLILFFLPLFVFAGPTKEEQFKISLRTVIANSTRSDVFPGMVVASPSRRDPDYYYDWVRDTALTMRALVDYYETSRDEKIKKLIYTWIDAEIYRQGLLSISGLGEPKYNVNGTVFTGPWGRPQNDGPALRAISMIKFARLLLSEGNHDYVLKKLYHGSLPAKSAIKIDLEYTAHEWRKPSFDLWEEEMGMHFYTLLAQHTALQEGAVLADDLGDSLAAEYYRKQADLIAHKLKIEFINEEVGILVTKDKVGGLWYKKSGLDVAPLLALLHTSPYQKIFAFGHPSVKKYIKALTLNAKQIYSINKIFPDIGVAIGRYQEDRYDGYGTDGSGNPWFLSTLALAEYYCLLREENKSLLLTDAIERQFERALFHSDRQGHFSEQFNRESGHMQGAYDLTWSHNAFMTSMMRCKLL